MKDLLKKEQNGLSYLEDQSSQLRKGILKLLKIKDSDIRLDNLYQCRYAADRAIHIGGASSATIPMVSLYYGGLLDIDIEQPTTTDQDMFVLSKGHAVATLASIYADLGYIKRSVLKNSRSIDSILNGHPGPLLPGVHLATGPMGQGMGVAQGFAIAGQRIPNFDVFALTGDGELQEGPIWESVMYAGYKGLENLCVMVDHNGGQLDTVSHLHYPYHDMPKSFESFGWRAIEVDATQYHNVYDALAEFKYGERDGRPTAIICNSTKGHGGFSDFMNTHKTTIPDDILDQEVALQERERSKRIESFCRYFDELDGNEEVTEITSALCSYAEAMSYEIISEEGIVSQVNRVEAQKKTKKASPRDKKITYSDDALPNLQKGKEYAAHKVIEAAMKEFAKDERIMSVDSDLASTSGLQSGVGFVDKTRALNVGVAEANMSLIGEAFSILGYNAWISTFCPFFDWKMMRRMAVGHQERLEVIENEGWLSEGHALDLTMIAAAADLETKANGATHMGNDDALFYNEAAQVDVINVSCPQQLLSILKWIMEGNKGIIYLRILRSAASVIYDSDFKFEFGKAYTVRKAKTPAAYVVSTGRGVHEALNAAEQLISDGIEISVIDMPSIDEERILELNQSGKPVFVVEQNNGYLWTNFQEVLFDRKQQIDIANLHPINTTTGRGRHYIHSGTYDELAAFYGVDAEHLSEKIAKLVRN